MSSFNTQQIHPLIPNSNSYVVEKKFVSIHSQDRDLKSYPISSLFEIELPQSYENVQSVRLNNWSFPANYNVFGLESNNLIFIFSLKDIYNPSENGVNDPIAIAVYKLLVKINNSDRDFASYKAVITEGFYNPDQMANELSARMNQAVNTKLLVLAEKIRDEEGDASYIESLLQYGEYDQFVVAYNSVSQKLYFGNKSSSFSIDNSSDLYLSENIIFDGSCKLDPRKLPDFSNWGLPAFLGFTRVSQVSREGKLEREYQFYYGDAKRVGDNGKWLVADLPGAQVSYVVPPAKINFMGPAYFYMELTTNSSFNCIDETSPFNVSEFTLTTNQTNGRVDSAFAKIAIPTTPISQWFDNADQPYKWFNPPMQRFRKVACKLRYHNGQLVNFGTFDFSFTLELMIVKPQIQTNLAKNIPSFSDSFS